MGDLKRACWLLNGRELRRIVRLYIDEKSWVECVSSISFVSLRFRFFTDWSLIALTSGRDAKLDTL